MAETIGANAQVALVTGVGRAAGIGFEVCRQLAQQGMTVLLTARDLAKAEASAGQLAGEGLRVQPYALDITQEQSVRQLAQEIEREFGRLDVLINNAGAYVDGSEAATTADLHAVMTVLEINLLGAWRTSQILLPLLRQSEHGRIVNVSSGAGSHGDQQFGLTTSRGAVASYGVSKAALNALTAKFAAELEGSGILVNAVCPGLTATAPGMEAMGARPVADGAASVVWAARLPDDGPSGGFFRDGQPLPW
jgi:NAD(P)-dependent dehydrogenase (short-subunit alcohol dehydrogenase family)